MKIGKIIRNLRRKKNITLGEVAKKAGLSISSLSQIERDLTNPSFAALSKIAKALNVPLVSLFENSDKGPTGENRVVLIKKEKRKKVIFVSDGIIYELLTPIRNVEVEFMLMRIKEGEGKDVMTVHKGEEHIYVMKGTLEVRIQKDTYTLEEGDSIFFQSSFPHTFRNIGKGEVNAILVVSPPAMFEQIYKSNIRSL